MMYGKSGGSACLKIAERLLQVQLHGMQACNSLAAKLCSALHDAVRLTSE